MEIKNKYGKNKIYGNKSKDLVKEDGQGTIKVCNEYIYLGTKITADGGHDVEINERINKDTSRAKQIN